MDEEEKSYTNLEKVPGKQIKRSRGVRARIQVKLQLSTRLVNGDRESREQDSESEVRDGSQNLKGEGERLSKAVHHNAPSDAVVVYRSSFLVAIGGLRSTICSKIFGRGSHRAILSSLRLSLPPSSLQLDLGSCSPNPALCRSV